MSKKILLISYRLGMSKLLYWDSILSAIKKEYFNFRVFTAFPKLETIDKSISTECELDGLKFYRNPGKTKATLLYIPLPFFLLKVKQFKPDLIILNEFNLSCFYVLLFNFISYKSKKLLLVESDPFVGYENKHTLFRNTIRKFIVRRCDIILTNNTLGYNYLTKVLKCKSDKITISPYLSSVPPTSVSVLKNHNSNKGKIRFLFVGQIIERKGLIYVLNAINQLPNEIQEKIQFDVIGKGNIFDELQKIKIQNELHCVNFLGFVEYEKLGYFYSLADCFILNTLHDYRALVGFEALTSGCAIIGSKYDGARFETIHEGKNGFIVDPENTNDIKVAITKLVNNPELLNKYKNYSRKISKEFTAVKCNENILSVLDNI
jgi:glycosyltransferase involved in cell wall biosynthesis